MLPVPPAFRTFLPCLTSTLVFPGTTSQISYVPWHLSSRSVSERIIYRVVKLLGYKTWLFWINIKSKCIHVYAYVYMYMCIVRLISKVVCILTDTEWQLSFKLLMLLDFLLIFTYHMSRKSYHIIVLFFIPSLLELLLSLWNEYVTCMLTRCSLNISYFQLIIFQS